MDLMKKIFLAMLIGITIDFSTAAKLKNLHKQIDDITSGISKEMQRGIIPSKKEELYAKKLRSFFIELTNDKANEENSNDVWKVLFAFQDLQNNIRKQFPNITDEEYLKANNSIGRALKAKGNFNSDQVIEVLIKEALCLSTAARISLNIHYEYHCEDFKQYDPRILNFYKSTAQEGLLRSQLDYGKALLHGLGTKKNIKQGLGYINKAAQSGLDEATLELATYYFNTNDKVNFEKYLRLGAKQNNVPALYNLGVLEQNNKKFKEAIDCFKKVLNLDPNYQEARLELGRMYSEGWGVPKDDKVGYELIKEVSEKTEDNQLKAIAYANLGIFAQFGRGTELSIAKARDYFNQAIKLGYSDAKTLLENLETTKK